MIEENICKQLHIKYIRQQQTIYVPTSDAKRFVEECRKRHIIILGIDAMYISDTETRPLIDGIADFSTETNSNKSCNNSLHFLSQAEVSSATHFEFVLQD